LLRVPKAELGEILRIPPFEFSSLDGEGKRNGVGDDVDEEARLVTEVTAADTAAVIGVIADVDDVEALGS
jgi:hypothetical protein